MQEQRRQEILKKGSIPEFVQIRNTMDFYQVYQEANHRNKLLIESQRQQQLQTHTAYADDEGFFVFAHPFDFSFTCVADWFLFSSKFKKSVSKINFSNGIFEIQMSNV